MCRENSDKIAGIAERVVVMDLILMKLLLTPTLIACVSLAQRRWGSVVGGLLVGLPLTSAPLLLVLSLENGPRFAAQAATAALCGQACAAVFCFGYAQAAMRHRRQRCVLAAAGCYLITALVADGLRISVLLLGILVVTVVAMVVSYWPVPVERSARVVVSPSWELPMRMLVSVVFTLGLAGAASLLGPARAGLLAAFPVFVCILAVRNHRSTGDPATIDFLRGTVQSIWSGTAFFLTVALTITTMGTAVAFGTGLGVAAVVALGTGLLRKRVVARQVSKEPARSTAGAGHC